LDHVVDKDRGEIELSNRLQVETTVLRFIELINSDDVSGLPLAEQVELHGPLTPEPVRGQAEVRDHLQQIAPFILNANTRKVIIEGNSAAVLADIESVNGVHLEEAFFLEVEDGKIREVRTVFDSRPLFAGRND